jgi:hypothetical protein
MNTNVRLLAALAALVVGCIAVVIVVGLLRGIFA